MRGVLSTALTGAVIMAFGVGCQAAFAPTVRVTCPARTTVAPDCDLRWLAAFDQLTIRHTPLPALRAGNEIVRLPPPRWARRGGTTTLFLQTSAGPVRTIMWGDHLSLQHDLRDPLHDYFEDPHASAIDLTMRPSRWVDPGGTADNRMVRKTHPVRVVSDALVAVGLLFWILLPAQIVRAIARSNHER